MDREFQSHYNLEILASNPTGTPRLSSTGLITVQVDDVNDNEPIFENDIYVFEIEENKVEDSLVGKVFAKDLDDGDNGRIR